MFRRPAKRTLFAKVYLCRPAREERKDIKKLFTKGYGDVRKKIRVVHGEEGQGGRDGELSTCPSLSPLLRVFALLRRAAFLLWTARVVIKGGPARHDDGYPPRRIGGIGFASGGRVKSRRFFVKYYYV